MDITIQGVKFNVPDAAIAQYAAGNTLTLDEGTASTLVQVFCENVRNNFASKVRDAYNGEEQLPQEKVQELQHQFNEYASTYHFGVRRPGTGPRRADPVERMAVRLSKEDIRKAFKARHGEDIKAEQLNSAVERLLSARGEEYFNRARALLREMEQVSESTLEAAGL